MMKGWKTWLAVAAFIALGVIDIINGDQQAGIEKISGAIALAGIGHKLEKAKQGGAHADVQ